MSEFVILKSGSGSSSGGRGVLYNFLSLSFDILIEMLLFYNSSQ